MAAPTSIWQIGLVVADHAAARAELHAMFGLTFPEPRERSFGRHTITLSIAPQGPPYFEVIQGELGGPWDGTVRNRLDHVSYWVDDLDAERDRLLGEGFPLFVDGNELGIPANYHHLPKTSLRLEPLTSEYKELMKEGWGLSSVEGGHHPGGPWQFGVMVDDIEASRDELSRALGLEWTSVQKRGDGTLSVCMSTQGPPYWELVQAGPGTKLASQPSPQFNHLAYWVDDLAAESARLEAAGIVFAQEMRPQIRFYEGKKCGVRVELMSASYRDVVRNGWDLDDVG